MTRSRQTLLVCLVGSQLLLSGCGGTSQDDMRRYAIRRKPAKDDSDVATLASASTGSSNVQPDVTASSKPEGPLDSLTKVRTGNSVSSSPTPQQATATEDRVPSEAKVATLAEVVPSAIPTAEPLSAAEARERTASNLTEIGGAWRAYYHQKGYFPGPITSATKKPLLSWRVALLPSLGLQSLYDAFHLDEAWDSPHNITLLDKIPSVYQSPERFDTKTNYLALAQGTTTVYQERRKVSERIIEDGIENTLALVEVDEQRAVPWTQPAEFSLVMATPLESLGELRENGLFVVWSNGKPSWIDGTVDPKLFAKACTIDAGDGFRGSQIAKDLSIGTALPADEPASDIALGETTTAAPEDGTPETDSPTNATKRPTLRDAQASLKSERAGERRALYEKKPLPSVAELKVARDLLRELYQADYAAAETAPQRLQLARKMLDHLPDLGADVPGQYALLEIVKQISIQDGGVYNALDAAEQMTARFELQDDVWFDTFEKLARTANERRELERLLDEADHAFDEFVLAGQYVAAERLSRLAISAAKKAGDEDAFNKFTTRRQWTGEAKDLHKAAEEALATLEQNPDDRQANSDVGKFLCLIKNDWDNGLVILSNGNDRSLQRLAAMETGDLSDPMRKLELADLWWREAESASAALKATMQKRARNWYEQALPGLPAGLVRIRAQRRIEELGKPSP